MKKSVLLGMGITFLMMWQVIVAQPGVRDKAIFVEKKDEFKEQLKERAQQRQKKAEEKTLELKMDFSGVEIPASVEEFKRVWYHPPISQGLTGSCWAFASTSFFESEIYRLSKRKIKLSEMFTVYWEYVEKARRFVQERGESVFGRGSEANATIRIWKQYGIVPASAYTGMMKDTEFYDDTQMFSEMKAYLESVKEHNAWNENAVVETIKSILNHYMGEPPSTITIDGKEMTPKEYLQKVLKLNLDDYVSVMSFMEKPYYQMVELEVPDNWWHSQEYYNVPLDDFMKIIKTSIRNGYSVCMVGDNSEPGFYPQLDVAMVPTFDIPAEYIDENVRQFRFSNESTTDDHAIHLVGFLEKDGKDWYLIKDSGTKAQNGKHKGYMFYHEDFVRLKMLSILVHKDMLKSAGIR